MAEIGELLRELRLKKDLSIDDIQEITKIRSRYIQAIEEGNLDRLPGQFYAKAFIKAYAEVVELDPAILAEYQDALPNPEIENIQIKPQYSSLSSTRSKLGKWLFVSLIYLLIALILIFAYIFYVSYTSEQNNNIPGETIDNGFEIIDLPKIEKEDSLTDDQSKPQDNTEVEQSNDDIQITKVSTSTFKYKPYDVYEVVVSEGTSVQIELKFNDRCWFDIRDGDKDGKQLETNNLGAGEATQVFTLNEQLWIHLGNASGADIYINNKQIKAGSEQGPKYISIMKKQQ